ncbi:MULTISPECIES: RNA polymerase sigma factor [Flavobacteriaceae]|uniref:RNA polymerase sigma factor CnrH n=1 Tax=Arenibacter algicola TaxID=616991 RepID=A0A221UYX4_9FLAO|nr:RNA polymerase sigma-70 factor [Arenibacter algicola]ASO06463.1 RNA polymerase sigma factor CnrH [Arenibacter algicola]|tara:strand:- start:617 stop:1213 length:597 start_codon:yes stop_codon:yes gene_type:complete
MKWDFENQTTLIEDLKKGNENAYVYLVEHYHNRLCVYANSLIRDDLMAEDIVQNVFVQVWEKRHKLKHDFSLENYLYKSVHNKFIDQYRKGKAVMALERKYIEALELAVEEKDEMQEQKILGILFDAIHELPPKCKQIFLLSKKEGLTNMEISEYLNVSKKTVEGQITKAFGILREKLGRKYEVIMLIVFGSETKKMV